MGANPFTETGSGFCTMSTKLSVREDEEDRASDANPEGLPKLTVAVKDAKATREMMFTLRHFSSGRSGSR